MAQWAEIPIDGKLFQNADELLVSDKMAAVENAYHIEEGGFSRWPGYRVFCEIDAERIYLADWGGNLIAVTDKGRAYRIDKQGNATDVTSVVLSGGNRPIFDKTEFELLIAAGGPILALSSGRTRILSPDAPNSTHVAVVDGYAIAIEPLSGRFYHCSPGEYSSWSPIDVFTAEGKPDDLTACVVTPYRELLLAGEDSIEQFERSASGSSRPFFRRWTTGEGIASPYTLVAFKNGTYGVNKLREFVAFQSQVSRPQSDDIGLSLSKVDDWRDAWATVLHIKGQKFIMLQMPHATNAYGTEGITLLLDYRGKRWSHLYGWDEARGLPARYPAWSAHRLWDRNFIGVPGGVAELTDTTYRHGTGIQRFYIRTGMIDKWGRAARVDELEWTIKRGVSAQAPADEERLTLRATRDDAVRTRWIEKGLGRPGNRDALVRLGGLGVADRWQFEIACTDDVPIEVKRGRAYVEPLHR